VVDARRAGRREWHPFPKRNSIERFAAKVCHRYA
jgi:hypothetical protein